MLLETRKNGHLQVPQTALPRRDQGGSFLVCAVWQWIRSLGSLQMAIFSRELAKFLQTESLPLFWDVKDWSVPSEKVPGSRLPQIGTDICSFVQPPNCRNSCNFCRKSGNFCRKLSEIGEKKLRKVQKSGFSKKPGKRVEVQKFFPI